MRRVYALRNGVVADSLRHAGSPYPVIMGVNVPQLKEIAADMQSAELARNLRSRTRIREAVMLASMVMPVKELPYAEALQWASEINSIEGADILCHSLLRKTDYAPSLAIELLENGITDLQRYTAVRLMWNLVYTHGAMFRKAAEAEAANTGSISGQLAQSLIREIDDTQD